MSSTKTDHYFRLLTLLFEGPTKLLLEILLKRAGHTFLTLDSYLNSQQAFLQRKLPRYQYNHLFRAGIKIEKKIFDISLTYNLLTKLFSLPNQEAQWITDIKDIRDNLSHRCDSFEIDETDFVDMWQGLMDATKGLAGQISQGYLQEMTDIVEDVKQRSLPPPGPYVDILREWLGTMNDKINELRDDIKTLKESSESSTSILKKTVYVDTRKGEPATKRMKILDPNLERMQGSFKKTMEALPDDFTASSESDDMFKKLSESRRLYVTGPESSQYLKTALFVIRLFGIAINRCVEMMGCSDWKHVNSDDVSLVIFRDPFGNHHISSERIRETHNCLDSIDTEIVKMPLTDRMFVIITSDYCAHLQYMDKCFGDPHDILTDIVIFQKPTTEADPHVITDERHSLTFATDTCSQLKTLQEHTKMYVDYYARKSFTAHRFEDAKKILKQHKMLAINGPLSSGKTSLATKVMALYSPDQSVLLKTPTDMRYIRFGAVSMVLIEDFTGKYAPNKQTAIEWYGVFDFLLPAVLSGKLSVIVVAEAESFRGCQLPIHGLLKYGITLTSPVLHSIKPEPELDIATGDANMMVNALTSRTGLRKSLRNACFEDGKTFHLERENGFVKACTLMPSGHLLIAYDGCVVLMDINFKFVSQKDVSDVTDIATVNDTSVIITSNDQYIQYIHVNLSAVLPYLTHFKSIDVGEKVICKGIDANDTDIFVLCYISGLYEIRVLHKGSGIVHNAISLDSLRHSVGLVIKVSLNGDRVYVASATSVRCINTQGDILYTFSHQYNTTAEPYVDNENNLLVCSELSTNINLIDKDGREMKTVLNDSDGIYLPRALCFREVDSCLLVVCENKKIIMFKVKW